MKRLEQVMFSRVVNTPFKKFIPPNNNTAFNKFLVWIITAGGGGRHNMRFISRFTFII